MVRKARGRLDSGRRTAGYETGSRGFLGLSPAPDNTAELDLHGLTVDEALPALEEFLHQSFRCGRHRVRVVHGKDTGILKTEVGRFLSGHSLVGSFRPANGRNGGGGATAGPLSGRERA